MKPQDVKDFYGSKYNFNKKTGMSANTLGNWLRLGKIPEGAQHRIERLTHGQLKAEWIEREELNENN